MNDKSVAPILVCPADRTPLSPASGQMVARLNRAIAAGQVTNHAGRLLEQPLDGGLVRADQTLLYPILDGIPILLADEAIPLAQIR